MGRTMGLAEHLEKLTTRTIDVLVEWVNYFVSIAPKKDGQEFQKALDAIYKACSGMLSEVHRVAFVESSMRVVIGHYLIALAARAKKTPQLTQTVKGELEALTKVPAVAHLSQSEDPKKSSAVAVQCDRVASNFKTFLEDEKESSAKNALQQLLAFLHGVATPNSPVLGQLAALRKPLAGVPLASFQIKESIPRLLWRFSCKIISFTPNTAVAEKGTASRSVLAQKTKYICQLTVMTTGNSQSEIQVTTPAAPSKSGLVWANNGWDFEGDFQSAEVKLEEKGVISDRVVASASLEKAKVRYQAVLSACLANSAHYSGAYFPLTLELETKEGVVIGNLEIEVRLREGVGSGQPKKKKAGFLSLGHFTTTKVVEPGWRFNRDLLTANLTDFMFPLSNIVERWHLAAPKYLQDDIAEEDREKVNGTMAALTALKDLYMMQDDEWIRARDQVWVGLVKATQDCGNSSVSMGFAVLYFKLNPKSKWVGFINGGTGGVKMQMYGFKNGRVFTILEGKPGAAKFSKLAIRNYRPEKYGMNAYPPDGKLSPHEVMKLELKQALNDAPWKNSSVLAHLGLPASSSRGKPTVPIFAFLTGVIREHWEKQPAHTQAEMEQDVAAIFAYADASVQPATLLLPGEGKKSFFIPQKQEGQRELVAVRAMYDAMAAQRVELKDVEVVSSLGIGTGSSQWCSIGPNDDPESYLTTSIHCGMRKQDLVQRLGSELVKDLQSEHGKLLKAFTRKLRSYVLTEDGQPAIIFKRPVIALKSGASLGMWSSVFPKLRKELCAPRSPHEGVTFAEVCAIMSHNSIQYLDMHVRGGFAEFRTTKEPPAWLRARSSKEKWGSLSSLDSIVPALEFCYGTAVTEGWDKGRHVGIDTFLKKFRDMSTNETDPVILKEMFTKFDASLCKYVSWLEPLRNKNDAQRCEVANTCAEGCDKILRCRAIVTSHEKAGSSGGDQAVEVKEDKASDLPEAAFQAFSKLQTQCLTELTTTLIARVLAVFRGEDKRPLQEIVLHCTTLSSPRIRLASDVRAQLVNLTVPVLRPEDLEEVKSIMEPLMDTSQHSQRAWAQSFQALEKRAQRAQEGTPVETNRPTTSSTSSRVAAFLHKSP